MTDAAQDARRPLPVVAIDGPAGVGKSTTARQVAAELGYVLVDTGALYRGVALACRERGVPWSDEESVTRCAESLQLRFEPTDDGSARLHIDDADRADDIRTPEIASGASQVSAYRGVRAALLDLQRRLGETGGVVLEGRDIGTVVFPDAEVKIFLIASPEERAKRRVQDLAQRGISANYEELLTQIQARDQADSTRDVAPLRPADDAQTLDSTQLSQPEVVAQILRIVLDAANPSELPHKTPTNRS